MCVFRIFHTIEPEQIERIAPNKKDLYHFAILSIVSVILKKIKYKAIQ